MGYDYELGVVLSFPLPLPGRGLNSNCPTSSEVARHVSLASDLTDCYSLDCPQLAWALHRPIYSTIAFLSEHHTHTHSPPVRSAASAPQSSLLAGRTTTITISSISTSKSTSSCSAFILPIPLPLPIPIPHAGPQLPIIRLPP